VEDANISDCDTLTDEVKINLNMLGVLMLDEVVGEVDRTDVVTVDQCGSRQGAMEHRKQMTDLTHLRHAVGHGVVLRLSTRRKENQTYPLFSYKHACKIVALKVIKVVPELDNLR
jgi:hypothetical protein